MLGCSALEKTHVLLDGGAFNFVAWIVSTMELFSAQKRRQMVLHLKFTDETAQLKLQSLSTFFSNLSLNSSDLLLESHRVAQVQNGQVQWQSTSVQAYPLLKQTVAWVLDGRESLLLSYARSEASTLAQDATQADTKVELKIDKKTDIKADAKVDTKADVNVNTKAYANAEIQVEAKADIKADANAETQVEAKAEADRKSSANNKETVSVEANLTQLRAQIDKVDESLAALLAQRQSLVKQAAGLKHQSGEGVVSAQRQINMLKHGAELEHRFALPEQLMQDIQRRILRQSYREKGSGHYACAYPYNKCTVAMVGGAGGMARLFSGYLAGSNYQVLTIEKDDYAVNLDGSKVSRIEDSKAAYYLSQADWCIVSVPIDVTEQVVKTIAPLLKEGCILSDFTSIKERPMQAMLSSYSGPVLGLHPMFGPDTASLVRQVIVAVEGRYLERCRFVIEQFKLYGAYVIECSASEHDQAMRVIQALRHFTTFAYGVFLKQLARNMQDSANLNLENSSTVMQVNQAAAVPSETQSSNQIKEPLSEVELGENAFVKRLLLLSSPIYHLELMMVGRLFAQDPNLYCDIISASCDNLKLIREYLDCSAQCLEVLERDDKAKFIDEFKHTSDFFGKYAKLFLKESADILAKAQDNYPADLD